MTERMTAAQMLSTRGTRQLTLAMEQFGWTKPVVLRKMTMRERDHFAKLSREGDAAELKATAALLRIGLAEPALTPEEADQMVDLDADALEYILRNILTFNGLTKEAATDIQKQFHAEPRPEVPVSAGAETA